MGMGEGIKFKSVSEGRPPGSGHGFSSECEILTQCPGPEEMAVSWIYRAGKP